MLTLKLSKLFQIKILLPKLNHLKKYFCDQQKKMSSHHFVKENQEPALIIANGQHCSEALLGQLLEWSPYVIVLDGALDKVMSLGVKFDVLLGDFDRMEANQELFPNQPDIEIVHTPDQNKTDLEKALDF